jgi:hypothetical protein
MRWNWRYWRVEPTATDSNVRVVLQALIGPALSLFLVVLIASVSAQLWGWISFGQAWPFFALFVAIITADSIRGAFRRRERSVSAAVIPNEFEGSAQSTPI